MKATLSASPPPVQYSADIPSAPGYYVYRLWAEDGRCLYVGRIGNNGPRPPAVRLHHHRRTQPWWIEVARIEIASLPDHPSIIAEEAVQIAALRPAHNRQRGNCTHDLSLPGAVSASTGACRLCIKKDPEYRREYASRPEVIARRRAYHARPDVKAAQQARNLARPSRSKRRPGPGQLPLGEF